MSLNVCDIHPKPEGGGETRAHQGPRSKAGDLIARLSTSGTEYVKEKVGCKHDKCGYPNLRRRC